ncbi:uncharacterized protein LOC123540929 [Mercenaria mercenaria]|uniref:uncharacterized protein LOC123540929 n=1 Tax=Mercenaria mercenaria TaxID=6596 RepID=UPI00234EB029|nr:uncharacterized protein LOC123540929 [Mercenaria mercenaria]
MLKYALTVCILCLIKADSFSNDLRRNIKIYQHVYFNYNIRDFPDEAIKNQRRKSLEPVKIKTTDALLIDENSSDNGKKTRQSSGPVIMKISDALLIDENSFFNDRQKRESSGPVTMKISDALLIDENSFFNDRQKRESSGPVNMKISDALLIDENSFYKDRQKRESSGPVNMKISDALLIDENSFFNDRQKRESSGPVNMKISDALLIDENSFFNDRQKRESSGPVNMKISDALLIDENSFDNGREKRESSGPVRKKINDFSNHREQKSKTDNFDILGVIKPQYVNETSDFWGKESGTKSSYMCNKNDKISQQEWFQISKTLYPNVPSEKYSYFMHWKAMVRLYTKDRVSSSWFRHTFPQIKPRTALKFIGSTDIFQKLFWPFVLKVGFMNQRLGLFGFTEETVPVQIQKTIFYNAVEKLQTIKIPVAEGKVIYSFDNNVDLIDGMNRSGLLENSKDFIDAGHHLFTQDEQNEITRKVDEAMKLIQETNPELYSAINQMVACFAFYKSQNRAHIGGTVSSALGVIWLDPSALSNWSIPFYAEQIIHEFIHTSLFYAELVHGTFTDHRDLSKAKVMSSIRRQLRDYDKSFHAAYVSTGLVAFHSKAGFFNRAEALAKPLISSVDELVKVNKQTGILTDSGEAMLQTLVDFLTVVRLKV